MVVCRDYDGRTALHLAAAEGHTHCVQFLVAGCGVSPLLRDRWGFTPLVEAARFHHTPLVELLLEHVRQKMGQVTSWDMMEVVTLHCNAGRVRAEPRGGGQAPGEGENQAAGHSCSVAGHSCLVAGHSCSVAGHSLLVAGYSWSVAGHS